MVTKIQSVVRGWLQQRRYHVLVYTNHTAATEIQAVWRGYRVRCAVSWPS